MAEQGTDFELLGRGLAAIDGVAAVRSLHSKRTATNDYMAPYTYSYGGAPISDRVLETLRNASLVPCSDGGVQVEWHIHGWDVEIEIGPDGVLTCFSNEKALGGRGDY